MKIGILTFHNAMNYGAILQCYALQQYLKSEFKCEVYIVDYTPRYFNKVFFDPCKPLEADGFKNKIKAIAKLIIKHDEMVKASQKIHYLQEFITKKLNCRSTRYDDLDTFYDTIVVGSDQIWNLELLDNDVTYLLPNIMKCKKVSYAASFKIQDVDSFALQQYRKLLPSFDSLSVRESNLVDYLHEKVGVNSTCVLDPTLLVNNEFWEREEKNSRVLKDEYIVIYHVNKPDKLIDTAFEYAAERNLKVISLNKLTGYKDYLDCSNASIEVFLNLFRYAECVFTTSFHGMVFSIVYKKDFYFEVPEGSYNNNARLTDLANKTGLISRNISFGIDKTPINWALVEHNIINNRQISRKYIEDALTHSEGPYD